MDKKEGGLAQEINLPLFLSFDALRDIRGDQDRAAQYAPIYACMDWTTDYIAKPHPDIGRPGVICPRVPLSLKADSLYWGVYHQEEIDDVQADLLVDSLDDLFLSLRPVDRPHSLLKALLLVMPQNTDAARQSVEKVQRAFKERSLKKSILLGKFHSELRTTALNNSNFRPGLSPYPILAFRYAIDTDIRFMLTTGAPAHLKIGWIHAFLGTMGNDLPAEEIQRLQQKIKELESEDV